MYSQITAVLFSVTLAKFSPFVVILLVAIEKKMNEKFLAESGCMKYPTRSNNQKTIIFVCVCSNTFFLQYLKRVSVFFYYPAT